MPLAVFAMLMFAIFTWLGAGTVEPVMNARIWSRYWRADASVPLRALSILAASSSRLAAAIHQRHARRDDHPRQQVPELAEDLPVVLALQRLAWVKPQHPPLC